MATKALHHAFELAERPSLAGLMRQQSLPADVVTLIRIAAHSPEALSEEVARTGRSPKFIRDASVLYLQQVLFHHGADAYRILGASSAATQDELSQHMRLLMKWLHPDRDRSEWESTFAERVSGAWDQLKSAERRAEYDRTTAASQTRRAPRRKKSRRPAVKGLQRLPSVERQPERVEWPAAKIAARSAAAVILVVIALAVLLLPEKPAPWLSAPTEAGDSLAIDAANGKD